LRLAAQGGGAFDEQRVCERLRQVAAELALRYVEFLREQAGRAAGSTVSLEPAGRLPRTALLFERERHPEAHRPNAPSASPSERSSGR
jgi:hypothetical protein